MRNVIIFGAGASFDAGVPLLGGFMDKMWEFARRRSIAGKPLSDADARIFDRAIEIRDELNIYHGRASFDDRNIEDILSILSFNALAGDKKDRNKLSSFNEAITRTIELSCEVTHPGVFPRGEGQIHEIGSDHYRAFWKALFASVSRDRALPHILTFNYDLVFERALLQVLIGTSYNGYDSGRRAPFKSFKIDYQYENVPSQIFSVDNADYGGFSSDRKGGTVMTEVTDHSKEPEQVIEILKLHGSVNFPRSKLGAEAKDYVLTKTQADPFILPPIFNKLSTSAPNKMWSTGLNRLREAANVIIVGYSLPRTDIYMQYFLKAALGPNVNLNRIFVFDPALWKDDVAGQEMKARIEDCFAPQLKNRICFRHEDKFSQTQPQLAGTFKHFVQLLDSSPNSILF